MSKHLDKIEKKIEQIEKHHDKASMLCEEIKDLIAELQETSLEDEPENFDDLEDEDLDEDLDEDEVIDDEE
jgi:tryptophanyl-tRNA synthetase